MNSGVYKIVNLQTGKYYVGSTKNFKIRKQSHFSRLKNNNHTNKHLQNAYNKYGEENFKFKIIEYVNQELLLNIEQKYINNSKKENIYNKTYIAGAGGYDTLSISVYLLDLKGNIIDEYESIIEASRQLKTSISNRKINTSSIIRTKYRLVTCQFYNENKIIINSWKKFSNIKDFISNRTKNKKILLLEKDDVILEFKNTKEIMEYLNVTKQYVSYLIKNNKYIRYKYPKLNEK